MRTNLRNECGAQYMAILASIDIRTGKRPVRWSCSQFLIWTSVSTAYTAWIDAAASPRSTPYSRSYPVYSFEGAVECRLIRKSTLNGDVGKRQAGIRHNISGPIHTAFN